jgi:hypothetical protein
MDYSEFLFSQLFMEHVNHEDTIYNRYIEYDIIYPEILRHYELYTTSKFNVDTMGEYECILKYLTNEITKTT